MVYGFIGVEAVGIIMYLEIKFDNTGATVMVVHHSGKNEEAGTRGLSALKGVLDVELMEKCDGKETALILSCMKMKDAEAPHTYTYDFKPLNTTSVRMETQ